MRKLKLNILPHWKSMFWGLLYYSAPPVTLFYTLRGRLDFLDIDGFVTSILRPETAVLTVLFLLFLPNMLAYIVCIAEWFRYRKRIKESKQDYVRQKCGPPGTGKSATAGVEAVVLARHLKNVMREKHWLLLQKSYVRPLSELEQADFDELAEAINFYKQNPGGQWCLFSTVPMRVGKNMSYELTVDHLAQVSRLPAYAVGYADEIGNVIDNDTKASEALEPVAEMSRFTRHDGEFRLIFTEQEQKNFFKDLRRNVAYIEKMKKQRSKLSPRLPYWTARFFLFWIWVFGYKIKIPRFGIFLKKCLSFSQSVGFRVFVSKKIGSEFDNDEVLKKRERAVVPACLNYTYNDRTFRNSYRCLHKPIQGELWRSLLVSKQHIEQDRAFRQKIKLKKKQNPKKDT